MAVILFDPMHGANVIFHDPPYDQAAGVGVRSTGLLGPGTLEFAGPQMRLRGERAAKIVPVAVGSIVGVLALIAAALFMIESEWLPSGRGALKLTVLIAVVAGVLPGYGVYALLRRLLPRTNVEEVLGAANVVVLSRTHDAVVLRLAGARLRGDTAITAADQNAWAVLSAMFPPRY